MDSWQMTNKEPYFQAEKKWKRSKTNIRQRYDEMCYWILSESSSSENKMGQFDIVSVTKNGRKIR